MRSDVLCTGCELELCRLYCPKCIKKSGTKVTPRRIELEDSMQGQGNFLLKNGKILPLHHNSHN
jgi:hypothetical protein